MNGFENLYENVIGAGLCTNCGTCAAVCPRRAIGMDYELEEAFLCGECGADCKLCLEVCPGKDIDLPGLNLTAFGRVPIPAEVNLGVRLRYLKCHAVDPAIRDAGAGGGVVTALLCYASDQKLIDGAVVAGMKSEKPWRVEPKLAENSTQIRTYAQSRYSSAPTNQILRQAVSGGKKALAVVGLPCHMHALRKMQAVNRPKDLVRAVTYRIALLCGVNSHHQTWEHLIEEGLKIPVEDVVNLEFRAGDYPGALRVTLRDGSVVSRGYGTLAGAPFYRDRCLMCCDYSGEVSDISVGDYYHPDMKPGARGWSCVIVRNDTGDRLVESAAAAGYIHCEPVAESYMMGLGWELKRHVAVFRLLERRRHNWPVPDYHVRLEYPRPQSRTVEMKPPYSVGGVGDSE